MSLGNGPPDDRVVIAPVRTSDGKRPRALARRVRAWSAIRAECAATIVSPQQAASRARIRLVGTLVLFLWCCLVLSLGAVPARAADASFEVGAAVADISPPLHGQVPATIRPNVIAVGPSTDPGCSRSRSRTSTFNTMVTMTLETRMWTATGTDAGMETCSAAATQLHVSLTRSPIM